MSLGFNLIRHSNNWNPNASTECEIIVLFVCFAGTAICKNKPLVSL